LPILNTEKANDNNFASVQLDVRALLCLVILVALLFLPVSLLVASGYADDGGYARILQYFLSTGKVDLMHWSQPNTVGLLVLAAPMVSVSGFGFAQLDLIGILYTIAVSIATYLFARAYLSPAFSIAVASALFCFSEITLVAPTFMTDMPFLAYCAWWLYFTQKILSGSTNRLSIYTYWCVSLLLAVMTRSTIILFFPGILIASVLCREHRKKLLLLSGLFVICVGITLVINRWLVINPMGLLEVTSLKKIFVDHDWSMLDVRATAISTVSVLFAVAPLMIAMGAGPRTLRPIECVLTLFFFLLSSYLSTKGYFAFAPLMVLGCAISAFHLPTLMSKSFEVNRPLWVILVSSILCQISVMPIMAHPLTRHAIPVMLVMIFLCAMANFWNKKFLKIYVPLAALLILYNVIALQQVRLIQYGTWKLAEMLVSSGVKPENIDAGWAWFCYYGLEPGSFQKEGYRERFRLWQKNADFAITADDIDGNNRAGYRTMSQVPFSYMWQTKSLRILTVQNSSVKNSLTVHPND
jgi:hypothetical protein